MLLMSGCMYSGHHFGGGRLLAPGRSSLSLGAGAYPSMSLGCDDADAHVIGTPAGSACQRWRDWNMDSLGNMVPDVDTVPAAVNTVYVRSASIGWRLGLAGALGPFRGAEMGIHLEAPTNPVSAEFDLKLGLPAPAGGFRHAFAAGWGIGMWADNSWFGEYAASHEIGKHSLFSNYRATRLSTQFYDFDGAEEKRKFPSKRRLIHQGALGFAWSTGAGWPEIVAPLIVATYPQAPYGENAIEANMLREAGWSLALGMRWGLK